MTLRTVFHELLTDPRRMLIERWNWKAALFSSTFRALIFLSTNLTAGWKAATGAMLAEFLYRAACSGFYGAITQAFSRVKPGWTAALTTAFLLPLVSHSIELGVHLLCGTPNITLSLIASIGFTLLSTLFNLYAMQRGALVVGAGSGSISSDLRRMPRLLSGFFVSGFVPVYELVRCRSWRRFLTCTVHWQVGDLPHSLLESDRQNRIDLSRPIRRN